MKSIQEVMSNRNYTYSVAFLCDGKIVKANVTLENSRDASLFDKWLENEKDNSVYAADGGPNDIEI